MNNFIKALNIASNEFNDKITQEDELIIKYYYGEMVKNLAREYQNNMSNQGLKESSKDLADKYAEKVNFM